MHAFTARITISCDIVPKVRARVQLRLLPTANTIPVEASRIIYIYGAFQGKVLIKQRNFHINPEQTRREEFNSIFIAFLLLKTERRRPSLIFIYSTYYHIYDILY